MCTSRYTLHATPRTATKTKIMLQGMAPLWKKWTQYWECKQTMSCLKISDIRVCINNSCILMLHFKCEDQCILRPDIFKLPPFLFRYIINNPNLCIERQDVYLLMMVRTVAAHVDRRMAIRDTWAATFNLPGVSLLVVFLLGASR